MSVILQNTEEKCRNVQTLLESMDSLPFSAEHSETLFNKLQTIIASVSRSKKKVMVRTEKGKELSTNAHHIATELENTISKMGNPNADTESSDNAIALITQLEKEVSKIETYWKMYEAAIT